MAEAIGATVFVGLSVDHCLHLAHAYHQAPGDRLGKMRHALVLTGASILGGALTTMAGTAFLLPCRIILFQKLGAERLYETERKMRLDALRELGGVHDLHLFLLEPHAHHLRTHRKHGRFLPMPQAGRLLWLMVDCQALFSTPWCARYHQPGRAGHVPSFLTSGRGGPCGLCASQAVGACSMPL